MNNINDIVPVKSKTDFISDVKKWALLDSQLKIVNEKTKKMREMKQELTKNICEYMESNRIQQSKIEISDGELRLYEKREYTPLTYSYIQESLEKIIKNPDHIDYIIQYLKDHREVKIIKDIRKVPIK